MVIKPLQISYVTGSGGMVREAFAGPPGFPFRSRLGLSDSLSVAEISHGEPGFLYRMK